MRSLFWVNLRDVMLVARTVPDEAEPLELGGPCPQGCKGRRVVVIDYGKGTFGCGPEFQREVWHYIGGPIVQASKDGESLVMYDASGTELNRWQGEVA